MPYVEIEFGDLEFHETLGRGSAGSVYRAVWKSKEKVVAVKKLNLLENEVEVLSSLSHRNIIQFFGAVTIAPNYCIVTEFAESGSLYEYLKQTSIDFQQILQWAKQIALGMNYLHYEAPITVIHRDLKSKNVVIAADLTAKLCDFGSSKFHPHTTKLSLVGTFPWMAPEVIQQQPVTAACDVFSYGVVLWELLTHEVPYKGVEGLQVAWLVVAKEQRLTIPSGCPPVFAHLMQRCWSTLPQDRLTFKQILLELDKMLEEGMTLQEETDSFLRRKPEWTGEIERKLEELKKMESSLSSREQEIKKKEQQLAVREKHLESISSRKADPGEEDAHAVEQWTEQEVVDWLFSMDSTELAQYATLFEYHHINGRSLFLLRAEDLLQMGIHSLGHQKELLEEVEQLRRTNHRLLHFPPLQHQQNKSTSMPVLLEPKTENLTIIFGSLCRKGLTPRENKWKYLVDFDGSWAGLVHSVQFIFSLSIPSDIVSLSQPPFLSPGWRTGLPNPVDCIIYYKTDRVHRPVDTRYRFTPSVNDPTQEICVKLFLHPSKKIIYNFTSKESAITPESPNKNSETIVPLPHGRTKSSPHLSGIWASRSQVIRPPLPVTTGEGSNEKDSPSSSTRRVSFGRGAQGAWSKPGSGAAVVKSNSIIGYSTSMHPQQDSGGSVSSSRSSTPNDPMNSELQPSGTPVKFRIGNYTRQLEHSKSGPVRHRGGDTSRRSRPVGEQFSRNSYPQFPDKQYDHQHRSHDSDKEVEGQMWQKVTKSRGEKSGKGNSSARRVSGSGQEVLGYQRSSSGQAGRQESWKRFQKKPFSEPTLRNDPPSLRKSEHKLARPQGTGK